MPGEGLFVELFKDNDLMTDIDFDDKILDTLVNELETSLKNEVLPLTEENIVEQMEQDWKSALVEDTRSGML